MLSEGERNIIKGISNLNETMNKGFLALNKNLSSIAKSLKVLEGENVPIEKEECNLLSEPEENRWRLAIGPDAELPGDEYDWVLVKIKSININDSIMVYSIPHIAEFRKNINQWWALEWDEAYESIKIPYKVVYWKPIID